MCDGSLHPNSIHNCCKKGTGLCIIVVINATTGHGRWCCTVKEERGARGRGRDTDGWRGRTSWWWVERAYNQRWVLAPRMGGGRESFLPNSGRNSTRTTLILQQLHNEFLINDQIRVKNFRRPSRGWLHYVYLGQWISCIMYWCFCMHESFI